MKKVIGLVLALALLATLFCCPAVAEEKIEIAFAHYNSCEFISLLEEGIRAGLEGKNVELTVFDSTFDSGVQLSQIENLISSGVDGIILAPADQNAVVPAIGMCAEANMPLVVVNSSLFTDEDYYFSGPDDIMAGKIEAQAIVDALEGKGNVLIMECTLGTSWELERKEGIYSVLDQYPDIKVLDCQCTEGLRDQAMEQMENWLTAYGDDIDAVISENDDAAMGAVSVLQAAGRTDVLVIGVDAIADALKAVVDGTMLATVYQDAGLEGGIAAEKILQLIAGEKPAEMKTLIDMKLITKDEAAALLK